MPGRLIPTMTEASSLLQAFGGKLAEVHVSRGRNTAQSHNRLAPVAVSKGGCADSRENPVVLEPLADQGQSEMGVEIRRAEALNMARLVAASFDAIRQQRKNLAFTGARFLSAVTYPKSRSRSDEVLIFPPKYRRSLNRWRGTRTPESDGRWRTPDSISFDEIAFTPANASDRRYDDLEQS